MFVYNSTDIGIFIMVARTLNISQAAQRLNISQSTVSKRLKELEESLHLTLVERGQGMKALRLTMAGENFLSIANEMQRLWEQAQHME
nr:LysR family transcriptional regulator [Megasphaera hominis]